METDRDLTDYRGILGFSCLLGTPRKYGLKTVKKYDASTNTSDVLARYDVTKHVNFI
jgi:hypothetical protein